MNGVTVTVSVSGSYEKTGGVPLVAFRMLNRPSAGATPVWVSRIPTRMLWSPVTCALILPVSSRIRMESAPTPICCSPNRRSGRKSDAKTPTDVSDPTVSTS